MRVNRLPVYKIIGSIVINELSMTLDTLITEALSLLESLLSTKLFYMFCMVS